MASSTASTWRKRDRRHGNMGRRRKAFESRQSTPSYQALFAGYGEPGQAVPAGAVKAEKPAKPSKSSTSA
jgi:hypothetical protein